MMMLLPALRLAIPLSIPLFCSLPPSLPPTFYPLLACVGYPLSLPRPRLDPVICPPGIDIEAYIRAKFSDGDGDAEFLLTTSDAILALAAATGGGDVDVEAVRSTDLMLRHCRNPEVRLLACVCVARVLGVGEVDIISNPSPTLCYVTARARVAGPRVGCV